MISEIMLAAAMLTPWGEKVTDGNAWREYPRPQMVRSNWTCLNGSWDYQITTVTNTPGRPKAWAGKIRVPFAIESVLSGVGRLLETHEFLWYTRKIVCDPKPGRRILLHFDGVDYMTMVFIGHREVTDVPHVGAQEPFTLDITDFVEKGENELTVCVWDPTGTSEGDAAHVNSRGKQDMRTHACFYTRVSGIWQSVWMEEVPEKHIRDYRVFTDIDKGTVRFEFDKVEGAGEVEVKTDLPKDFVCWTPENPKLYTFTAKYGEDEIRGYFAMRKIEKRRDAKGIWRYFLNNEPIFMYGPLDQGWWPDGLLTPPSDEAMAHDIKTLKSCGFNMMRKHIKVEPRRYYHLCDKLGMIVFQDLPCFNGAWNSPRRTDTIFGYATQRAELKAMIDNLRKCPCVLEWIPYNEGWSQPGEFLTHSTMDFVKRYDATRLVGGPSGYWDWEGGARTPRNGYEAWLEPGGRVKTFSCAHKPAGECEMCDSVDMHYYRGPGMPEVNDRRISFLGEFGGLGHAVSNHLWVAFDQAAAYRRQNPGKTSSWGYGGMGDTATRAGLEAAYLKQVREVAALAEKGLGGAIYTQTSDVEIEINGFMTYDRRVLKFDAAKIRAAHEDVIRRAAKAAKTPYPAVTSVVPKWGEFKTEDAKASAARPADFDAYWDGEVARFAKEIPLRPEIAPRPDLSNDKADIHEVSFAVNADGSRRLYGWLAFPKKCAKDAKLPLYVEVPGAGYGFWTTDPAYSADEIQLKLTVYDFCPKPRNGKGSKADYDAFVTRWTDRYHTSAYSNAGWGASREEVFFHDVWLTMNRAVDWVAETYAAQIDARRVSYTGESQGGGSGFFLLAMNKRFTHGVLRVPAVTDVLGFLSGRKSGWPQPFENQPTPAAKARVLEIAPYFDAASFAPRIKVPVRVCLGTADVTCPWPNVSAAFNALGSKDKELLIGLGDDHCSNNNGQRQKMEQWRHAR